MTREIRRWLDNAVLWSGEAETVKDAIHQALASGANLRDANLRGANLPLLTAGGQSLESWW